MANLDLSDLLTKVIDSNEALLIADRPLSELSTRSVKELREAGLSAVSAERLSSTFKLARLIHTIKLEPQVLISTSQQIFDAFHRKLKDLKVEQFWGVLIDGRSRFLSEYLVSQGILTASLVHPREVFRPAIRAAAAGLILLHNHPSNDPEPSPEDIEITRRLVAVGELVGIRVIDHVIIAGGTYVSFIERGLIPTIGQS